MNQTYIKKLSLTILATLACGAAFAQGPMSAPAYNGPMTQDVAAPAPPPLYTNFSSYISSDGNATLCNPCTYDTNNGFLILAIGNCWGIANPQSTAFSFVLATGPRSITSAQVAVTLGAPVCTKDKKKFDVVNYTDD